jgi:hypothetical protein
MHARESAFEKARPTATDSANMRASRARQPTIVNSRAPRLVQELTAPLCAIVPHARTM